MYVACTAAAMTEPSPLSATDFQVLLVLTRGELYGYAIMKAVAEESSGRIRPEIGSLYRVLSRLMERGLVEETEAPTAAPDTHPGRDRRYYRLTRAGRAAARAEAVRLSQLVELARARDVLPEGPAR